MQLFPIVLIAIVLAADQSFVLSDTSFGATPGVSAAVAWIPIGVILLLTWGAVRMCLKRLERGGSFQLILVAERVTHYSRWLILINHAIAVLALGWLHTVRDVIGNPILIDEIIAITPPIVGLIGTWWIFYPVERRLRESLTVRRLDEGLTIHPIPSRWRYVGVQVRMGLLLLLVPILMIVGLAETIRWTASQLPWEWVGNVTEGATLFAAAVVFLFAPLIARVLLHVQPLAAGELRMSLLAICARHKVRVRELLLWNTSGSMINAAVMGLIGRLRYVLITDALIESMSSDEVRAVMAHEVGHVRRHHLPWLLAALMAALVLAQVMLEGPLRIAYAFGLPLLNDNDILRQVMMGAMFVQLAIALWVFGWVSRRFERQADTFAVQHLSQHGTAIAPHGSAAVTAQETATSDPQRITPEAVTAMTGALGRISQLNAVDPNRHSWRHGSIAWRVSYLRSIIGAPIDHLPIDRKVKRINTASAAILVLAGVAWGLWWWFGV